MGRCIDMTSESQRVISVLIEEGIAARSHFQVWWVLRNTALPRFCATMNHEQYVDFFAASSAGNYKLFLLALSKIFDRDSRVAGLQALKKTLASEGRSDLADRIERELSPHQQTVSALLGIRNQSLVHNEQGVPRADVYKANPVTPNQIEALLDAVCNVVNEVALALGTTNVIFDSARTSDATLRMLEALERGTIEHADRAK